MFERPKYRIYVQYAVKPGLQPMPFLFPHLKKIHVDEKTIDLFENLVVSYLKQDGTSVSKIASKTYKNLLTFYEEYFEN